MGAAKKRLLLKIVGERALVNNFLKYLYTAKILYFILKNLDEKEKICSFIHAFLYFACFHIINCTTLTDHLHLYVKALWQ